MIKKIGVGLLAVVIIGLLKPMIGGLILLSIVCTAGISLVVWIPLLWLIGSVVLGVIKSGWSPPSQPGKKEEIVSEQTGPFLREHLAIERYIDRAQFYGLTREKILSELKNGGWSDVEIQAAYGKYVAAH